MEKFLRTAPLDVRAEPFLRKGPHASVFADMVRTLNIDMVVTATHGRGGLKKLLLGSVAEEIFRSVACPVLTVGPDVTNRDLTRGELFEVLCAIDSSGSSHALANAAALASDYHAPRGFGTAAGSSDTYSADLSRQVALFRTFAFNSPPTILTFPQLLYGRSDVIHR